MASNSTASFAIENIRYGSYNTNEFITMWEEIKDLYNTLKGTSSYSDIPSQKIYRAYLLQRGYTPLPVQAVKYTLYNNTGITPTIGYFGPGSFSINMTGMFPETGSSYRATLAVPYQSHAFSASDVYVTRVNNNQLLLTTYNNSSSAGCNDWDNLFFEVIKQT